MEFDETNDSGVDAGNWPIIPVLRKRKLYRSSFIVVEGRDWP